MTTDQALSLLIRVLWVLFAAALLGGLIACLQVML